MLCFTFFLSGAMADLFFSILIIIRLVYLFSNIIHVLVTCQQMRQRLGTESLALEVEEVVRKRTESRCYICTCHPKQTKQHLNNNQAAIINSYEMTILNDVRDFHQQTSGNNAPQDYIGKISSHENYTVLSDKKFKPRYLKKNV